MPKKLNYYGLLSLMLLSSCLNPLPEKKALVPTPLPLSEKKATIHSPIQVNITRFSFEPQHVQISSGTTIVWKNYDRTGHSVGMLEGPQDFGTIQLDEGQSSKFRFDTVGKYVYKCGIHNTHPHVFATIEVK